ncbi:MAG: chorismate mutase [Silicimonas sp.]|nr:chorismate mutase [Silicimonas sp.]
MKAPEACNSMAELRAQIDLLDGELVALLARRAGYIDRAIALKPAEKLPARIPDRVEEVVANVRGRAEDAGLEPEIAERIWRELIEWSIRREAKVLEPNGTGS